MGMRVRKVAKSLGCSPQDVVGTLLAMGITRYKTTEDQLPDRIVGKLREAIRQGVKPVATTVHAKGPSASDTTPLSVEGGVMAQLMGDSFDSDVPVPTPETDEPAVDRSVVVELELAELARQKALLLAQQTQLTADKIAHEAQVALHLRAQLEWEAQCTETRVSDTAATQKVTPVTLAQLLTDRGLTSLTQWDAALGALGNAEILAPFLDTWLVNNPSALRRILANKVLLVEGRLPTQLPPSMVGITVPVGAGDIPDGIVLEEGLARFGEQLMLHGLRRVLVCGATRVCAWYLSQAIDSRVVIEFSENEQSTSAAIDMVIYWGATASADELSMWDQSTAVVIEVGSTGFDDLFRALDDYFR